MRSNMPWITGGVAAGFALLSWFAGAPSNDELPTLAAPTPPSASVPEPTSSDGVIAGDHFEVRYQLQLCQGELGRVRQ